MKRRIDWGVGGKIEMRRDERGKSRCDGVYKEWKRYEYVVEGIVCGIGENDKDRIGKVGWIGM